jgi:hypothetical protein
LTVLLSVVACDTPRRVTEPDTTAASFGGTWVGTRSIVSCSPAGPACAQHPAGLQQYFAVTFNPRGDVVDGSVVLSEPTPLALPSGFPITGRIAPSGQLSFDRFVFDDREPRYSGEVTRRTSFPIELTGRMTGEAIGAGAPILLVWTVSAVRR